METEESEVEASRELDARVAEVVMGWETEWADRHGSGFTTERWVTPSGQRIHPDNLPAFSADIAAAFEVVAKMEEDWALTIESDGSGEWWAARFWHGDTFHEADAPTLPLAICLAALKASETQPDPLTPEER